MGATILVTLLKKGCCVQRAPPRLPYFLFHCSNSISDFLLEETMCSSILNRSTLLFLFLRFLPAFLFKLLYGLAEDLRSNAQALFDTKGVH
mmetsp:Transcript_39909/g.73051  ORF Transcript_39909/g.73051 Transcript_39909/m.73051 type:complete len:91 (+) Transcript_39909:163-435(+)